MSNNSSQQSSGIGFAGALGLLFIGLKLGHVITWSWWWVTLPLWGGAVLALGALVVLVLVAAVVAAWKQVRR